MNPLDVYDVSLKNEHQLVYEEKKKGILHLFQRMRGVVDGRSYSKSNVIAEIYAQAESPQSELITHLLNKCVRVAPTQKKIWDELAQALLCPDDQVNINELVNEKDFDKLAKKIEKALPKDSELVKKIKQIHERVNISKTWQSLKCDISLLSTDYESVRLLVKERLAYTIVGFQNSSSYGQRCKPMKNIEGKLHILVDGVDTPVSELKERGSYYDRKLWQWYFKDRPEEPWNFYLPKGLVQIDRYSGPIVPVTKLDPEEHRVLLEHACKMCEPKQPQDPASKTHLEFSEENPPTCVMQLFINPRRFGQFPYFPLFSGVHAMAPMHVGFRLVDQSGNVYSTGIITAPEDEFREGAQNTFITVTGSPGIVDWEEFRPHEGRVVTSIPMTEKTHENILKELNLMREEKVRFNLLKQNCGRLATQIARIAGVRIRHKIDRGAFLFQLLPHVSHFPFLGNIMQKIQSFSNYVADKTKTPSLPEIEQITKKVIRLVLTPVRLVMNLFYNSVMLCLGAGKGSKVPEKLYTGLKLKSFPSLISSPFDMFRDNPTAGYHSGPIVDWQFAQKSTCFYRYEGPNMGILPNDVPIPEEKKRIFQPLSAEQVSYKDYFRRLRAWFEGKNA